MKKGKVTMIAKTQAVVSVLVSIDAPTTNAANAHPWENKKF